MSSNAVIESSATDYVNFPVWVLEDLDLTSLTWQISFNPTFDQTVTPVGATVVSGSGSHDTDRSDVTVRVLVGSGSGGTPLDEGDWYVYGHTTSGQRIIVFFIGVLTVK